MKGRNTKLLKHHWFTLVGDPIADRGRNRRCAEEDAGVGFGVATGAARSKDAADGAAGLHRNHC